MNTDYESIIKRVRCRRRIVLGVMIAVLAALLVAGTLHVEVMEVVVYHGFDVIHPIVLAVLASVVVLAGILAYAAVSVTVENAMLNECDPRKYLTLKAELDKNDHRDTMYATPYFYLGEFQTSLQYAKRAAANKRTSAEGLFYKARCEFFLERFDDMKDSIRQYTDVISRKAKRRAVDDALLNVLLLMQALAEDDHRQIDMYRAQTEAWSPAKAAEIFVRYLKGVAAMRLGDTHESVHQLMAVKEAAPHTILATMSDVLLADQNTIG